MRLSYALVPPRPIYHAVDRIFACVRQNAFAKKPTQKISSSHVSYKTPSCSPGSLLTRFCSQLSRSFAASFCNSTMVSNPLPSPPQRTIAQPERNSHNIPPSYQSSFYPCQSPTSHPPSSSSLSDRVARIAAPSRASGRNSPAALFLRRGGRRARRGVLLELRGSGRGACCCKNWAGISWRRRSAF